MAMLSAGSWINDPQPTRWFAGISVGRRSGRLKSVVLSGRGDGWDFRWRTAEAMTAPLEGSNLPLSELAQQALEALVLRCAINDSALEVIGVGHLGPSVDADLVAAELAERTGITVVGGFERRDRALGGRGMPLTPATDFLLFHSAKVNRLRLHLGGQVEVTLLPAGGALSDVICFEAGPGASLLDGLTQDLSRGALPYDSNGRLAVQGRCANSLLNNWLSHPYLLKPPPKMLSAPDFDVSFRMSSLALARDQRLTGRDVLCTANHFIQRFLVEALRRFLPARLNINEVIVTGSSSWNGFLWKLLCEGLPIRSIRRSDELGLSLEARSAWHAALMGYMAIENLPGNLPSQTGACRSAVLGQITPGGAENWDRCVCRLLDRFDADTSQAA